MKKEKTKTDEEKKTGLSEALRKTFKEIEKTEVIVTIGAVSAGVLLFLINQLYIVPVAPPLISSVMNILVGVIVLVPPSVVHYAHYTEIKSVEERFPDFLRDVVEGLRGGMTLPLSVTYAARMKYGALTPHVRRLSAQLSWGVPFEKALENFGVACKSRVISRAISTIIESHRSGGEIAEVLSSVGAATVEIDKIKRERLSRIYGQMTTGYIIFFVFIAVMVGMQRFLLPALAFPAVTAEGVAGVGEVAETVPAAAPAAAQFGPIFSHLAIIQGAFAGLAIGKMAEGTISAGIKHAVIMALIGYIAVTLAGVAPAEAGGLFALG